LSLGIYGAVIGFIGLFALGWDNKGDGSMWDKGPLDWLLVGWCLACAALALAAAKNVMIDLVDRPMFRITTSATVLVNAAAFLFVAIPNLDGTVWLVLGVPGILGMFGIAFWHRLSRHLDAPASNKSPERTRDR
jgi:hypothetical protein